MTVVNPVGDHRAITARSEQARLDAPGALATAPASTWNWRAIAAVVIPGLALLIAALA
ncbi:MAG TPA: hypothetical protein VF838_02100 [Trebonia sp.]